MYLSRPGDFIREAAGTQARWSRYKIGVEACDLIGRLGGSRSKVWSNQDSAAPTTAHEFQRSRNIRGPASASNAETFHTLLDANIQHLR